MKPQMLQKTGKWLGLESGKTINQSLEFGNTTHLLMTAENRVVKNQSVRISNKKKSKEKKSVRLWTSSL